MLMKLYYSSHNYANFIKVLNIFKKANLNFSSKAKDITEYWEKLI